MSNAGEVITFWFQPLGKKFAIARGWRGVPPDVGRFLGDWRATHSNSNYDWNYIMSHNDENPKFFLDGDFKNIFKKSPL